MRRSIVFESSRGYITLEPTGKSMSYRVWLHGPIAATCIGTFGAGLTNAFDRAKGKLA